MNRSVKNYFVNGCGRCSLGGTPQCKVHTWTEPLLHLRQLLRETELEETSKWGVVCYTLNGKNVLLLSAFVDHCALSFFKGSLLDNAHGLLEAPGENSQAMRMLKFRGIQEVRDKEILIREVVAQAIETQRAGKSVKFRKNPEPIPEELEARFAEDPGLKAAFYALTPGRQRGYILHISSAKQSQTRLARIDKYADKIRRGEGMQDRPK